MLPAQTFEVVTTLTLLKLKEYRRVRYG